MWHHCNLVFINTRNIITNNNLFSGVTGVNCEEHSYGFEEFSYLEFPPLNPRYNFISLEFATVKQNSLLLYNPGEPSSSEFFALEIVDGQLRLSFDLGSGVTRLETIKPVADGSFHNVTIRRIGNVCHLSAQQICITFILIVIIILKVILFADSLFGG